MTMKVHEETIKSTRKKHPNEGRYPCRPSQEVLHAGMRLLDSLSPEEQQQMKNNDLVIDEEETAELYDEIKVGDVIGLGGLAPNTGFIALMMKVEEVKDGEDYMLCRPVTFSDEQDPIEITFQDISVGMAMGFAEILYRDEKPFGINEEEEHKIRITYDDGKDEDGNVQQPGTEAQVEKSPAEATPSEAGEEAAQATAPATPDLAQVEEWSDLYYAFGGGAEELMPKYVILSPKALWDTHGVLDENNNPYDKVRILNLQKTKIPCFFTYNQTWTEEQLRTKLDRVGAQENEAILNNNMIEKAQQKAQEVEEARKKAQEEVQGQ